MTARRSKRQGLAEAKRPKAGRAGIDRALADHKRAEAVDAAEAEEAAAKAKRDEEKPEKMTFLFEPDLAAELRAASNRVPLEDFGGTLSGMVARVVRVELEKLRRQWNDGEPFKSAMPVRKGRPPKR